MLRAIVTCAISRPATPHARRFRRSKTGVALAAVACLAGLLVAPAGSAADGASLSPCRLKGIEREVRCGTVDRPEDPDQPDGRRIAIRFAVVPAVAKSKSPDPVFVLAGGPGQSAMRVAAMMQPLLSGLNARRDIVYVDQRGTGESNALRCERAGTVPSLAEAMDPARAAERLAACVESLKARADTRQYATWIAIGDLDAVRAALGAERVNLWGGSYGTRAALEYLRQFPQRARSVVIDGVAPATMALPASFSVDSDAALGALLAACAGDTACRTRYPRLDDELRQLRATAERGTRIEVAHPLTGASEAVTFDAQVLAALLRTPLYAPQLGAVLPYALAHAARGHYEPLFSLSLALMGRMAEDFADVMHFAVVCAEDLPRVDTAARAAAAATRFGAGFADLYARACAHVPVRPVPDAFYAPPSADVPVLILSGGADPVTPPRHGQSVARTLPRALHLVAPNLGHGVTQHVCAHELIARFVRQADAPGREPFAGLEASREAGCLARVPAPPAFHPPQPGSP